MNNGKILIEDGKYETEYEIKNYKYEKGNLQISLGKEISKKEREGIKLKLKCKEQKGVE